MERKKKMKQSSKLRGLILAGALVVAMADTADTVFEDFAVWLAAN